MPSREKIFDRMKNSPNGGWKIKDCIAVANCFTVINRKGKGSHYIFHFGSDSLIIPDHGKIEPLYIKKFTKLMERHNGSSPA